MPFAALALVIALAVPPVPEPLPPVDLDVHEMPLGEIVSGLAALGHLEPVFETDVEDAATYPVTLRLENMPFERALGALSARTTLSIRVVGRRLVVSVPAERKAPPLLPDALAGAPRMPISRYFRTSRMQGDPESGPRPELPPLYLTVALGPRGGSAGVRFFRRSCSSPSSCRFPARTKRRSPSSSWLSIRFPAAAFSPWRGRR